MRSLVIAVIVGAVFATHVQSVDARPRPRSKKFTANKSFGLGIMLGAPTGLSGKYYLSTDTAIDFGVGVVRRFRARDGVHIHADHLWHPAVLLEDSAFVMPIYFGVGARIFDFEEDDRDDDVSVGVRVPAGIMIDFNNTPIDIFFELVFVMDFIVDRGNGYADFGGAIGLRYYF